MCFLPRRGLSVSDCEIARAFKVAANSIEAIAFIVPRKVRISLVFPPLAPFSTPVRAVGLVPIGYLPARALRRARAHRRRVLRGQDRPAQARLARGRRNLLWHRPALPPPAAAASGGPTASDKDILGVRACTCSCAGARSCTGIRTGHPGGECTSEAAVDRRECLRSAVCDEYMLTKCGRTELRRDGVAQGGERAADGGAARGAGADPQPGAAGRDRPCERAQGRSAARGLKSPRARASEGRGGACAGRWALVLGWAWTLDGKAGAVGAGGVRLKQMYVFSVRAAWRVSGVLFRGVQRCVL